MFFNNRKIISICFFLTLVFPSGVLADSGGRQTPGPEEMSANREGMDHFKQGYYKLMPRGHKTEAHAELVQAEKAFLRAIELNSDFVEAHRNLARLYYLQKKFEKAGNEYAEVMRLDPGDIDNYVLMALVETELGKFEEALRYLEKGKQATEDEKIIRKLDSYIQKLLSEQ